jgi:drug/metabolite transporter (DMT)-like permease
MEAIEQLQKFFTRFSFRGVIALIIVLCSFIFLFVITRRVIPEGNKETVNLAAGLVLGVLANVTNWYFGSSKEKSDGDKATALNTAAAIQKKDETLRE